MTVRRTTSPHLLDDLEPAPVRHHLLDVGLVVAGSEEEGRRLACARLSYSASVAGTRSVQLGSAHSQTNSVLSASKCSALSAIRSLTSRNSASFRARRSCSITFVSLRPVSSPDQENAMAVVRVSRYGHAVKRWPEPVERVAEVLARAGIDARVEEFREGTPTARRRGEGRRRLLAPDRQVAPLHLRRPSDARARPRRPAGRRDQGRGGRRRARRRASRSRTRSWPRRASSPAASRPSRLRASRRC